jgi:hypothetical protein
MVVKCLRFVFITQEELTMEQFGKNVDPKVALVEDSKENKKRGAKKKNAPTLSAVLGVIAVVGCLATIFFPTFCDNSRDGDVPVTNELSDEAPVMIDRIKEKKTTPSQKKAKPSTGSSNYYAYTKQNKS